MELIKKEKIIEQSLNHKYNVNATPKKIKKSGRARNISDSYLAANFLVMVDKLKHFKFVIIEFLNENSTEVVPTSWIKVDKNIQQFICQWPEKENVSEYASSQKKPFDAWECYACRPRKFFNTYSEAKRRLIKFCETSATEPEDFPISKLRDCIPKPQFDSFSEGENNSVKILCNSNLLCSSKVAQQTRHSEIQINNKLDITNIPKPTKPFDFFNNSDYDCTDVDTRKISLNLSSNGAFVSSLEMFPEENPTKAIEIDYTQEEHSSIHKMLNDIVHAIMNVSNNLNTLKKDVSIIKVDVIKNQELLNNLAENVRPAVFFSDTKQTINRAGLKLPVETIDELNDIEEDEDKLSTLARILQRDAKAFDAKRTTYMAMKLIMQNRVAEFLNMEGRRGDKIAFVKYKICTSVTDCVKDIFPQVSLAEIKCHISDWLKQAPRRK